MNRLDCAIDEEHSVSAGTGVGIYFSCPGMTQERITVLYNRIKGFTYRAAKLNWRMAQPDVEAGDLVRVMDNAGNAYVIPLMDYEFNCDGGFYGTIESKGKTQQEQDTGYKGPLQTKVDRTYSDLVSTKQVITDKITAFEGEFETINTNYLEVNKKLSALDAEIENLDVTELATKVAKIETSYVSKEYVQDLYATKAEVHVLDVDLERVNTLLAGSVTAGSTQTIVLNADNTTISNALIKSAMIDSLSADKVTAGTIDASSIHFKSQSGRLDIFGETLQVKDATRTRVQIGKDGTGDYALSQWDAQGNLMWDSRGAKAAAIKDKIIVNDMVSDNAGIEGKKINITSLVKEINDGTEVIKSSHILVDGANQSLSVVYNTITGDLSTLSTALSVEQGKISSLITDVSQAKGDVSTLQTNYSSLTQTVSGINSTVSSHSTSIDNLNNMEIGGRNLITNTRPDKPTINAMTSKWSVQIIEESTAISGKAMQATCVLGGTGGVYHGGSRRLETGKRYTWMVFVKASKQVRIGLGNEQNGILYCDITTEWNKFTHTFTANNNTHYQFIFYTANADNPWMVGDIISYHSLILVEGDKAPTWVPAPEDVDASIKTVSDKTSTLEQTVNGFSGRISSIETTANNASSKVTEITATVNGLTTTVANKTDKGAIISTINQSAEAIKIQASKLELTGYVTMTNLSTSGQTSIDGGNIKTRTITAAKIASGTITATQIAANTITGAKIASKTITADKISVTSLSVLTANLGTVTAGSLTSNTTISVSTNLTVGNNIYLNQNVNTTKYIYFNSSNYIRNLYTNSYNYITVNSNYRCALMSGSTSVYAYGNTGEAGISAAASIIFSSYGNGRLEHYGKYYDANWSSGFFRPLQAGTALGGSGASYRWYRLYAANTCSTSSDIRLKTNVKKYDVRYESMYMDLKPVTYELISTPGKTQCGLIAQWVKEAMDKNGISENEFALYEHDIREDSYSISYEQLTSLNMHMVQKTIKRVDAIDDELLSIKASRQQDAQELQQELQKRDFEISQLQYRIQQLESRS
ncbi:tail fiber domain-containing protein [[Clostridium] innocuum]|nr:tail fiber domain-containing protein [[Clostridium] innocuum]